MFLTTHGKGRTRVRRRGLGTVSTMVGNSLVYGSNPISNVRRPTSGIRVNPVPISVKVGVMPVWGSNPPFAILPGQYAAGNGYAYGSGWSAPDSPYGSSPQNPTGNTSLATAMALYQSNPSLLTQAQWTQLQQAGVVAGTVPYSSAAQTSGSGAIDPATGQTYASELAAAQAGASLTAATTTSTFDQTFAGLPLWIWLLIGVGGVFLLTSGRRR